MKTFKKFVYGTTLSTILYSLTLVTVNAYSSSTAPGFRDRKQLNQLFEQECKKLKIEDKNIKISLTDKELRAYTRRVGNEYTIVMHPQISSEVVLKHELYHIADGHLEENYGFFEPLVYWFYKEPQATIYSITGLEL